MDVKGSTSSVTEPLSRSSSRTRRWPVSRRRVLTIAILAAIAIGFCFLRADRQRPGTDFHARWLAGEWFRTGQPLYVYLPDIREPTYPPLAAFAFQPLSLLPLKVSAFVFGVVNLLLLLVAFRLTTSILDHLVPRRPRGWWPLLAVLLASGQYLLNNMSLLQVNLIWFVLGLLGIRAAIEKKEGRAAFALVAATFFKLIPVFLAFWLFVRGGRRSWIALFGAAAICLALPMIQRGLDQGFRDLSEYYETLLADFQEGRVITSYTNQNLGASIYRLTRPPARADQGDYRLVPLSEGGARGLYRGLLAFVIVVFTANLIALRARRRPIGPFELCSAFLIAHLVSGMTWKAHLVTMVFIAGAFLSMQPASLGRISRRVWWGLVGAMLLFGALGRELVGRRLHHDIGGYSLYGWLLLALFLASIVFCWRFRPDAEKGVA